MLARNCGSVAIALALFAVAVHAGGGTQKTAPPNAMTGTIKSVDMTTPSFILTTKSGMDRKFFVDDKTEFWGPKGGDRGTGPKGLKDECVASGYEIKLTASNDGKTARNVYLPNRKSEAK